MSIWTESLIELIKYLITFDYSTLKIGQIALYSSLALNIYLGLNLLIAKNYRFRCFLGSIKNIFIKPKTAEEYDAELAKMYDDYYQEVELQIAIENNIRNNGGI